MKPLFNALRYVFVTVVFILVVSLAGNTLTYFNFDPTYSFLKLKQEAIATGWYLPAYYSHVLISGIILVAGFFQLFPKSSSKYKRIHRIMGYIYVMGILFFAAPGGIAMSLFIGRGPWVLASFITLSILWFYFTSKAFSEIRKRNIVAHQQWMWRSYALTFSAVTLRLYIFITSYGFDLSKSEAYATLAWASWVPNLILVEILMNRSVYIRSSRVDL
jgi:hypothetical protein